MPVGKAPVEPQAVVDNDNDLEEGCQGVMDPGAGDNLARLADSRPLSVLESRSFHGCLPA